MTMQAEDDRAARAGAAQDSATLVLGEFASDAPTATITVTIASDRKVLHAAWRRMLAGETGIEVAGAPVMEATSLAACVEHQQPRVLLLDKALLEQLDPQSLHRLQQCCPQVRVLLVSDQICRGVVAEVLRNRFHGFLLTTSPPDVCRKAIRVVSQGELWLSRGLLVEAITEPLWPLVAGEDGVSPDPLRVHASEALTPRQLQVVERLHRGCSNKEIARELGVMEDTVKKHLQSVFAKLGVHRRVLVALRRLPG